MDSVTPYQGGLMKSLMSLWSRMAEESAILCCTSAHMDINTVHVRVKHEGLSFLTITLPDYGKAIQKWLDRGHAGFHPSFHSERGRGFPVFLGGFLGRVFDRSSGSLLDEPCIDSILALRQLTLMFGKLLVPCSAERERDAMRNFVECEQDVRQFDSTVTSDELSEYGRVSDLLFRSILTVVDREVYYHDLLPQHGPGATADRLSSNRKWSDASWTSRLEDITPAGEYLLPNWSWYSDLEDIDILEPGAETPMRVVSVPKTLKTPRIIAMEPTALQYMQQGISRSITEQIGKSDYLSKMVGFDDQTPNQRLALRGSLVGDLATLDLSDASDRVSNQLVRTMLRHWPFLDKAVDASRSRRADVPGFGVIRLAKFAPMGSALCFPIEAMVFTTLIFLGIQKSLNEPLTLSSIRKYKDSVRVYGDDIIVPVDHVLSVVEVLEHFGARVGLSKSFWTGRFRESCGREYYAGHDVSVVKVRRHFPTRQQNADEVVSLISLRNQLYFAGYWRTVDWLDSVIGKAIKFFPNVGPNSPVLGRACSLGWEAEKMDTSRLHRPLVKGFVVKGSPPKDHLEGRGALLKCLSLLERRVASQGSSDEDPPSQQWNTASNVVVPLAKSDEHLERSGRPKRVDIKLGWWPPY